jgi:TolB-like protein/class 3 adenylate cyclase
MSPQAFQRRLTAILSADVVGYSRLMRDDEDLTIRTLTGHREMMATLIDHNNGRIVDSPGDNLLAEFFSVIQAVDCAVEIQRELAERNAELPEDRRMEYRIGVNLGDVVKEGDRIYGDGVNIAARLESMAEPGGICISGFVYNQVKNRLKLEYEFVGEQFIKNIKEPVPVYRVLSLPGAAAHRVIKARKDAEKVSMGPSLMDKPSIAVLPFINMSNDPEQEYFSDGMTEELIGALAKLKGLKVISRTSAFYFKGEHVDLRTVGEKLKVDNVLEGSVRKAGNKLRISAQLIKVADDTHLWSESFNRELTDVFDIQEEISQAIVKNLRVKLLGMTDERLVKDYAKSNEAYELFLKGLFFQNKGFLKWNRATECYEMSIQADPDFVPAYAKLADLLTRRIIPHSSSPGETYQKVNELVLKALEIDDKYAYTYVAIAINKIQQEYDWPSAEKAYKRGIELNPGLSDVYAGYASYLLTLGRIDEAIVPIRRAMELDPLSIWIRMFRGFQLYCSHQLEQAIDIVQKDVELAPNDPLLLDPLVAAYAGKGMHETAISRLQQFSHIPLYASHLGWHYAKGGKRDEAWNILSEFLERADRGYFSPYMIAGIYAGLGEKDKVFEWLDKAYELHDPFQLYLKFFYWFADLHSDQRWTEQMKKRGLAD